MVLLSARRGWSGIVLGMKYLGLDYGAKRIGLAVSDGTGMIAFPRATIENNDRLLDELMHVVETERINCIVVGDARSVSGAENIVTAESDAFVEKMRKSVDIPIERAIEAWSSIEASRYAPDNKQHDDSSAAAVILQRYLDMKK